MRVIEAGKKTISNKKAAVRIVSMLLIIGILLVVLSPVFLPKWNTMEDGKSQYIVTGFYSEPQNTIDVIFIGNSCVYPGISPMEIWQNEGITSYAYSMGFLNIWSSYYSLKAALQTQKPKVVVLEMDEIFSEEAFDESYERKALDYLPLTKVKLEAINDPIYQNDFYKKTTYMLPVLRFHSRVLEIRPDDVTDLFINKHNMTKGYYLSTARKPYNDGNKYMEPTGEKAVIGKNADNYFSKIKALCDQNNIKLVLTNIPCASSWTYEKHSSVEELAKKHSLDYFDLNIIGDNIGLDLSKDSSDGGNHMNVYGAIKVSKYFSDYLADECKLEDHRNDPDYAGWNEDLASYNKLKSEELSKGN